MVLLATDVRRSFTGREQYTRDKQLSRRAAVTESSCHGEQLSRRAAGTESSCHGELVVWCTGALRVKVRILLYSTLCDASMWRRWTSGPRTATKFREFVAIANIWQQICAIWVRKYPELQG